MSKPIAVLISDIHYTPNTLHLADYALKEALNTAHYRNIPLIIAGDTLDTKAVIRSECANALIDILDPYVDLVKVFMLVGNHDLINEKSSDHSLNFLKPYCTIIESLQFNVELNSYLMPYISDLPQLKDDLQHLPEGCRLICHQGVRGADMGHYVKDSTSLDPEFFKAFRTISGHYHKAQDIKVGRPRKGAVGLFTYIGNPYTLSFGEANDPPKGYALLMDDGTLERIPLSLRKHVIVEASALDVLMGEYDINQRDLLWVKITGDRSMLNKIDKIELGERLFQRRDFKLELIETEQEVKEIVTAKLTDGEVFDTVIDGIAENDLYKSYLKNLWKEIL